MDCIFSQYSITERLFHFVSVNDFSRLAFTNSYLFQFSLKFYKNLTVHQQNYILLSHHNQLNYSMRIFHEWYCHVELGVYLIPVLSGKKWFLMIISLDRKYEKFVPISFDFEPPYQAKLGQPTLCYIPSFFTTLKKDISLIKFNFSSQSLFVLISNVNRVEFFLCSTCFTQCQQNSVEFVTKHQNVFPFLDISHPLHTHPAIGPKANLLIKYSEQDLTFFVHHEQSIYHYFGRELLKIHKVEIPLDFKFQYVVQNKYFVSHDMTSYLVYNWEEKSWFAAEIKPYYRSDLHMIYLGQSIICVAHDSKWNFIIFFNCKTMEEYVYYSRELVNILKQKHKFYYNLQIDKTFLIHHDIDALHIDILSMLPNKN